MERSARTPPLDCASDQRLRRALGPLLFYTGSRRSSPHRAPRQRTIAEHPWPHEMEPWRQGALDDYVGPTVPSDVVLTPAPEALLRSIRPLAAIGFPRERRFRSARNVDAPMEGSLDVDEERRRELLDRIRYMATSGLYADHTAIDAQLRLNINYPLVSECFADEVFKTHIDEMCSRVRTQHANCTSDQHAQRSARTGRGEGEEPGLLKR